mmetsp:Transcript_106520/g.306263  ORF Transcript_106520/g.306263 Transcript_106520/m.306263 type:complete len:368 (-) Transcript_106520:283-1386(-)
MWLKVRKSMSWGSGAPSRATGALTPVWTCDTQSNKMARILEFTAVVVLSVDHGLQTRSSSKKTSHLAMERMKRFASSEIGLPHRSSSSSIAFVARAWASERAPSSPMALSRRESRRSADSGEDNVSDSAKAPTSPMPFPPRHSSPRPTFWRADRAEAMARAPTSPRPKPLSSSSTRYGPASRHSRYRSRDDNEHILARAAKVGKRSMMACKISEGMSVKRRPWQATAARGNTLTCTNLARLMLDCGAVPLQRPPAAGVEGAAGGSAVEAADGCGCADDRTLNLRLGTRAPTGRGACACCCGCSETTGMCEGNGAPARRDAGVLSQQLCSEAPEAENQCDGEAGPSPGGIAGKGCCTHSDKDGAAAAV